MINELVQIIDELRKVTKQQNLNISDDNLFTNACSFYRGELAGKSKNFNWNEQKKESKEVRKASEKQLAYIQNLADKQGKNVKITNDMTFDEASLMIKELKDGDNKSRKST